MNFGTKSDREDLDTSLFGSLSITRSHILVSFGMDSDVESDGESFDTSLSHSLSSSRTHILVRCGIDSGVESDIESDRQSVNTSLSWTLSVSLSCDDSSDSNTSLRLDDMLKLSRTLSLSCPDVEIL